jgi:hypothetical protein
MGTAGTIGLQWSPRWHQKRRKPLSESENGLVKWVELRGLEPLTPTLPGRHDRVQGGSLWFRNGVGLGVRTAVNTRGQPRTTSTATTTATSPLSLSSEEHHMPKATKAASDL